MEDAVFYEKEGVELGRIKMNSVDDNKLEFYSENVQSKAR